MARHPRRAVLCLLILGAIASGSPAYSNPSAVAPSRCDAPECHQFDFWVGNWEVRTPQGKLAGTNRVEKILGGCVIEENWAGARGTTGRSFNIYSATDRKWHQTWVDSQGTLLMLAGEFRDGRMVLSAEAPADSGRTVTDRITWQKLDDGRVSQHWEVSTDGGRSWTDAFMGYYRRMNKGTR